MNPERVERGRPRVTNAKWRIATKSRYAAIILAGVVMLALLPVGAMHVLWPHLTWQNEPLHSTIETIGAVAAILMAIILLQRRPDEGNRRLFWVAIGLLGGGILDGFHAVTQPGHGFVLLHSMAVLVAGFGFALVWLPEPDRHPSLRKWVLWSVIVGSTLFGIWTLLFHDILPAMVQDGQFTNTARVMNLLSGVFFIAAGGRFLLDFHRSLKPELYLFTCMTLLFGLASLSFTFSALWDDVWWFWHVTRLLAYLLVMGFVVRGYLQTALSLRREITERQLAEGRTIHLTAVLRAIRNVNQLITREKDRQNLIQRSCDLLVLRKGFEKAWILLLDENRNFVTAASTGLGEVASVFLKQLETGNYPVCLRELLAQEQPFIAYDQPGKRHEGCVLANEHSRQGVFRCRLEHEGKFYGILGVALPSGAVSDKDEQDLFHELCGDIAFALANIEREEKLKQAEETLRQSEEKYRTLVDNALVGVFRSNLKGDILYVNDTLVKMLSFDSAEEMIAGGAVVRYKNQSDRAILIKELTEKGKVNSLEFEVLTKTEEIKNVILNAVLEGDILSGMLIDITERKKAEEQYKLLAEHSADIILRLSIKDERYSYVSPSVERILGYTDREALSLQPKDVLTIESYEKQKYEMFKDIESGISQHTLLLEAIHKDGHIIPVEVNARFVNDEKGQPVEIVGVVRDITERNKVAKALRVSEERLRNMIENAPVGIVISTLEGRVLEINKARLAMAGYDSKEEYISKPAPERYYDPKDREHWMALLREKGRVEGYEVRFKRKDGTSYWTSMSSISQISESGEQQLVMITQDITERKKAEEALLRSEENFRRSMDDSSLGIRVVSTEGDTLYANRAILDIYGYDSIEEMRATPAKKRYTPESYAEHQAREEKRQRGEYVPSKYEISVVRKDSKIRHLEVFRKEVLWNGHMQFQVLYNDITERKQAEKEIALLLDRESQAAREWQETFDAISDIVFQLSPSHEIRKINKAGCEATGKKLEDLIGKKCYNMVHGLNGPIRQCPCVEALKTREVYTSEYTEGGRYYLLTAYPIFDKGGEIISLTHIVKDITERKRMEEQLMVSDRLASIGQLASGIAHELNNPLTSVIGFSELLLEKDLPGDIKEDVITINREAKRTANVVKGLLTFARKQKTKKEPVDMSSIIQGVLQLRSYEQKVSNIEVKVRFADDLSQVMGNGGQLQQVFVNIVVNAEQAMLEAHGRGTLTITTEQVGDRVRASVTDDGPGISPENMRRLFTPFFTTKEVGKGTGLGLSICHGIVTEHGGKIYAKSELGKGATFVVELPVSKPQ